MTKRFICTLALLLIFIVPAIAQFPGVSAPKHYAWSDKSLSPDARADMVIVQHAVRK